jgi:hypothetical protein
MRGNEVPKSPVFPRDKRWSVEKRKDGYESEVSALIRHMLEDELIREDQRFAWERWRKDE